MPALRLRNQSAFTRFASPAGSAFTNIISELRSGFVSARPVLWPNAAGRSAPGTPGFAAKVTLSTKVPDAIVLSEPFTDGSGYAPRTLGMTSPGHVGPRVFASPHHERLTPSSEPRFPFIHAVGVSELGEQQLALLPAVPNLRRHHDEKR